MTAAPLKNVGIGVLAMALFTVCPTPGSRGPTRRPSARRINRSRRDRRSRCCPGFKIDRVTPADKTESYIVVTFDTLGRPVVSQSSSGNGSSPRLLLDADGDGTLRRREDRRRRS